MKKHLITSLHLAFWTVFVFFMLLLLGVLSKSDVIGEGEAGEFISILFCVLFLPAFLSFYSFYNYLFNFYREQRRVGLTILVGFGIALLSAVIGNVGLYFFIGFGFTCQQESNFVVIPVLTIIGFIFGSIAFVVKGFLTWAQELKLKEELLEKNYKTELALVKSQLDPHFLFNTINNIDVLILKDPEEASTYLNKLSDIMRFMLFNTKEALIPLQNELVYIEKYIELQKIRTSNLNYVNYTIEGDPANKRIAPMVFIPFIENAFKHTVNKKLEHAISIKVMISNSEIILNCANKYNPFSIDQVESHGLGNNLIERRLNLIYPDSHELIISDDGALYSVNLTITNEKL